MPQGPSTEMKKYALMGLAKPDVPQSWRVLTMMILTPAIALNN
jgi:hypothetical protein